MLVVLNKFTKRLFFKLQSKIVLKYIRPLGCQIKIILSILSYLLAKKSKKRASVGNRPEMSVRCQRSQVACMHPCYVNEMLTSLTLRLYSLRCTPLATVLGPYNPLFRAPKRCACFAHTQNSHRCLALKIGHGDPRSSFAISNSSSNRSKRSYRALPHGFIVSHRSGSSSVIAGRCDSRINIIAKNNTFQ